MSHLYNHLQDQQMMQAAAAHRALAAARPRILAAEALAERLTELGRPNGLVARAVGELDADGCTVICHIDGDLPTAQRLLDHLAVPLELIDWHEDWRLHTFQATAMGQDVTVVVRQPMPDSLTRMAA